MIEVLEPEHTRRLLERIGVLKHPCDLDLLVFFVRHPRTMMTSEHLAAFLGYELKRISESLDVLLGAGLLTRTPNPTHPARMYVFRPPGTGDGGWPELLGLASTREGRLALRRNLSSADSAGTSGPAARKDSPPPDTGRGRRPVLLRQTREPVDNEVPRTRQGGER